MARFHVKGPRALAFLTVALVVGACGTSGQNASESSPAASTPSAVSATQPTASPSQVDARLVIEDYGNSQVRLARLDAGDIAKVSGHLDGIAGIQPFEGQFLDLTCGLSVGIHQALKISFDSNPFRFGLGAKFGFQRWMDGDAHEEILRFAS